MSRRVFICTTNNQNLCRARRIYGGTGETKTAGFTTEDAEVRGEVHLDPTLMFLCDPPRPLRWKQISFGLRAKPAPSIPWFNPRFHCRRRLQKSRTAENNKARSAQCSRALFGLPKIIRTLAEPTSHHRVILQVRVGLGELVEFRLVVQIRFGDDKTADLFGSVSLDVGDSVNFRQIASHGGGAAASCHVRHAQRHQNSVDSLFSGRRFCKRIRRCGR